jgi:hypothetical protein
LGTRTALKSAVEFLVGELKITNERMGREA